MYKVRTEYSSYDKSSFFLLTDRQPPIPKIDLAFAITATTSDAGEIFQKMKDTISAIVTSYGLDKLHYAMIVFGDGSTTRVSFNESYTPEELNKFIETVPRRSGGPALTKALKAAENLFLPSQGSRPDAKKVLVLMTDKKSTDPLVELKRTAEPLALYNIHVIPVGFGNAVDRTELSVVASESDDVVVVRKEEDPNVLAKKIMEKARLGKITDKAYVYFAIQNQCNFP